MARNSSSSKPGERRGGRKKGTPNKTTGALKEMILQALSESGGVEYLREQAIAEPKAFLSLLGRVLPLQVTGDNNAPLVVEIVRHGADSTP